MIEGFHVSCGSRKRGIILETVAMMFSNLLKILSTRSEDASKLPKRGSRLLTQRVC